MAELRIVNITLVKRRGWRCLALMLNIYGVGMVRLSGNAVYTDVLKKKVHIIL